MIAATALTDCPPYTHNDLYVGTLHRACKAMGSIAALARALQMRQNSVNQMLQGQIKIPHSVFLTAVDILLWQGASQRNRLRASTS